MRAGRHPAWALEVLDPSGIESRARFWRRLPGRLVLIAGAVLVARLIHADTLSASALICVSASPLMIGGVRRLRDAGARQPFDAIAPWLFLGLGACLLMLASTSWQTMHRAIDSGHSPSGFYAFVVYGPLGAVLLAAGAGSALWGVARLAWAVGFLLQPSEARK